MKLNYPKTTNSKTSISLIVSVFNEEEVLSNFWLAIKSTIKTDLIDFDCQVVFVNDGSSDKSQSIINGFMKEDNDGIRVKSIEFSTNFGHEAAMIAGIDNTDDDIVICMDADLQHPPSAIKHMLEKYNEGFEIVLMNRTKRHDKKFFSNAMSKLFYVVIDLLSDTHFEKNASDFFMISKNVSTVLKNEYRERNRFLRGYIQILGFNITTLEFEAPARSAGKSNYSFKSLLKLASTAIFAFSNKPLIISLAFSLLFLLFSLGLMIFSLIVYFFGDTPPSGYTTLIMFQSIGFTILCFLISILSIYFGKSLSELRDRPIYLIKSIKQ
ncbi:MAG: glycosyltransferase family 2 protein [Tenuifilaceae bacterium]|nr:glycosyltransferase family 2 protein [Tenuifilaceae bacterium]